MDGGDEQAQQHSQNEHAGDDVAIAAPDALRKEIVGATDVVVEGLAD